MANNISISLPVEHVDDLLAGLFGAPPPGPTPAPAPHPAAVSPAQPMTRPAHPAQTMLAAAHPAAPAPVAPAAPVLPAMRGPLSAGEVTQAQMPVQEFHHPGMHIPLLDKLPLLGKIPLGNVVHDLGQFGKEAAIVGGSAVAPRLMPFIPGTPQHAMLQQAEQSEQADEESRRALQAAETYRAQHPPEKMVTTVGAGGQPTYVPESQAAGQPAYEKPTNPEVWTPVAGQPLEINRQTGETRPIPGAAGLPRGSSQVWGTVGTSKSEVPAILEPGVGYLDPATLQPIADFHEANPHSRTAMGIYSIMRTMEGAVKDNPNMRYLMPYLFQAEGIDVPPDVMAQLTAVAPGQPTDLSGTHIGTSMPGAPTAAMRQVAQRALALIPDVQQAAQDIPKEAADLGPGLGRWNAAKMAYGNPDPKYAALADRLSLIASGLSKAHLNTEIGVKAFDAMLASGSMTPEALKAGLDVIAPYLRILYLVGSGKPQEALKVNTGFGDAANVVQRLAAEFSGPAQPTKPTATAPKASPKIGTVAGGYKFMGGDPSKPASWKKVQ